MADPMNKEEVEALRAVLERIPQGKWEPYSDGDGPMHGIVIPGEQWHTVIHADNELCAGMSEQDARAHCDLHNSVERLLATVASRDAEAAAGKEQIERAVASLFVNGAGEQADRLVLWRDADKRDLGGWCQSAIVDVLRAAVARPSGGGA